jgi:serine/threonine-protein kinase
MGTVYLALSHGPGGFTKLKVVKVLNVELAGEPEFLRMFLNEARLAAQLNHPNIVQTNEVGVDGEDYFIEMEYLDGQAYSTLIRNALKAKVPIPLEIHLWILAQALAGLHYAHKLRGTNDEPLRIVHRDVSPHNVFVTYDGAIKVLDFGIAKAADTKGETRTGVVKGKARYMAPEQATKKPLDARADVFAVGVMLWEAVCGRRMWEGRDDVEVFLELSADRIPRAESFCPTLSPDLSAILSRALAPAPGDRYPSAEAMQLDLETYLETTHSRVGARAGAKLMNELFAERRVATKKAIDQQIELVRSGAAAVPIVPQLRENAAYQATMTGETGEDPREDTRGTRLLREETGKAAGARTPRGGGTPSARADERDGTRTGQPVSSNMPPAQRRRGVWIASSLVGALAVGFLGWRSTHPHTESSPATETRAPACASNAECTAKNGKPSLCSGDTGCAPIETSECHIVATPGAVANPATLWLGTMLPTSGVDAEETGRPNERGLEVAWEDLERTTQGLPSADGVAPPRPIALVACDDAPDHTKVAHHLVDDLHLPVIFGFNSLVDWAPTLLIPTRTMAVALINVSPLIASLPNVPNAPRLVWRTVLSLGFIGEALCRLLLQIVEPALQTGGASGKRQPLRVALVRSEENRALSDVVLHSLQFNGKTALENGEDFEEFVVPTQERPSGDAEIVAGLTRLAPNVILSQNTEENIRRIFLPLERHWTQGERRPVYLSERNVGGIAMDAAIAEIPSLRERFFGVYAPQNTPTNLRFTMRYNEGEPATKKTPYQLVPSPAYDAMYAVAYASFRAELDGAQSLTGVEIAQGMSSLSAGESVEVGPAELHTGFAALRRDHRLDLVGAGSSMNFDPVTGDVVTDLVVQCLRKARRGTGNTPLETSLRYSAAKSRWDGVLACPQN